MKAVVCGLLGVLLLCTCVAAESNVNCSTMQDCKSCVKQPSCVWCFVADAFLGSETSSDTPICVEGNLAGPKDQKCLSYRYVFCDGLFLSYPLSKQT